MDFSKTDKALLEIIQRRQELKALDYSNPKYDEIEEALHALEDRFQDAFGEELEEILQDVHDELCPDTDVLLPIAYLAQEYTKGKDGYSVATSEGVFVEVDKYPRKETKLVWGLSPLRLMLNVGKDKQEIVWESA